MLTVIDQHNGKVIQKVTTPRGKLLGYQSGQPGAPMQRHFFLWQARQAIGRVIQPPTNVTKPKSAYSQCTPGYRATAPGKGKGK